MFERAIDWLRERRDRLRKYGLVGTVVIFSVGLVVAIRATPEGLLDLRPNLLIAYAIVLPPITYFLQTIELMLNGRAVGARLTRKEAAEIVLYANAATYLPIPGGLLTRTAALRAKGVAVGRSASAVLLFTGLAGTVSFAYAGMWMVFRNPIMGVGAFALSAVGAVACLAIARKAQVPRAVIGQESLLRLTVNVYESVCYVIIFAAIGVPIDFSQASVLVVSGFIAMALTVFPSGMGVREAIVALISPLVGIDPATGFLASATARVVAIAWMIVLAVGLITLRSNDEAKGA